jgi:hypothetical protein
MACVVIGGGGGGGDDGGGSNTVQVYGRQCGAAIADPGALGCFGGGFGDNDDGVAVHDDGPIVTNTTIIIALAHVIIGSITLIHPTQELKSRIRNFAGDFTYKQ